MNVVTDATIDWHHGYANHPELKIKLAYPITEAELDGWWRAVKLDQEGTLLYAPIPNIPDLYAFALHTPDSESSWKGFAGHEFTRTTYTGEVFTGGNWWSSRAAYLPFPAHEVRSNAAPFGLTLALCPGEFSRYTRKAGGFMFNKLISASKTEYCKPELTTTEV